MDSFWAIGWTISGIGKEFIEYFSSRRFDDLVLQRSEDAIILDLLEIVLSVWSLMETSDLDNVYASAVRLIIFSKSMRRNSRIIEDHVMSHKETEKELILSLMVMLQQADL